MTSVRDVFMRTLLGLNTTLVAVIAFFLIQSYQEFKQVRENVSTIKSDMGLIKYQITVHEERLDHLDSR